MADVVIGVLTGAAAADAGWANAGTLAKKKAADRTARKLVRDVTNIFMGRCGNRGGSCQYCGSGFCPFDEFYAVNDNKRTIQLWACGAAGSALPWHGRGHRFDPDQVHQKVSRSVRFGAFH